MEAKLPLLLIFIEFEGAAGGGGGGGGPGGGGGGGGAAAGDDFTEFGDPELPSSSTDILDICLKTWRSVFGIVARTCLS